MRWRMYLAAQGPRNRSRTRIPFKSGDLHSVKAENHRIETSTLGSVCMRIAVGGSWSRIIGRRQVNATSCRECRTHPISAVADST